MSKQPSQLSRLAGIITGGSSDLSPSDLASRRSAAEAELQEAERLYRKAALDAEKGATGAIAAKAEATGTLRLAQERLRDVIAAQIEAEAERQEQQRRDRDAARAKQLSAAEQQLAARIKDAEAFAQAISEARARLDSLMEHTASAERAAPTLLPKGSLTERSKLAELVSLEISRIAGVEWGWLLGGKYIHSRMFDPNAITPLAETLAGANEYAIKNAR